MGWVSDSTKTAMHKARLLESKGLYRRALNVLVEAVPFGYDSEEQDALMRCIERNQRLLKKYSDLEAARGLEMCTVSLKDNYEFDYLFNPFKY